MFRLNTSNPAVTGVSHGHSQVITQQQTHHIPQQNTPAHQQHSTHQQHSHQPLGTVLSQLDAISVSGSNGPSENTIIINETILTAVKAEPMHDTASTSSTITNGHVIYTPIKRPRLEGNDDWLSSPSPGSVPSSAPPLSPSPGSQSHNYNTTMSNGYSSPMSNGSYNPYSPNGKIDVDGIKFVINFDYPQNSEDYIHRIGRTGRSESKGTSYAFFTDANMKQAKELVAVLREANQEIDPKLQAMANRASSFGGGNRRYGGGGGGGNRSNFGTF